MRIPERDNPFAWRARTKEGRAGAIHLLDSLTDEEVARYIDVARDQMQIEERLAALKVASAIFGVALAGYVVWRGLHQGLSGWDFAGLGLACAMGYWPWRVYTCRRLWWKHMKAATAELARRQAAQVSN